MSYVKSNPNFQPRQTQWGNNVTVINKDEALIKLHLRKGIPLPPELQVSGCSSRRPPACLSPHAPRHPVAPAELQARGCLLTPHALRRTPCAAPQVSRRTQHAARRTPHRKSRASRLTPRPTTGQAKKERLEAAAAESKSGVFSRLGGGKAARPGKPGTQCTRPPRTLAPPRTGPRLASRQGPTRSPP